jgi:ribosomal protein S18 acetylase RimI-like enzyme
VNPYPQTRTLVVGLLVLQLTPDHLLLENVAVTPHLHGHGIGSLLLRLAEEQARTGGVSEIRLYTNAAMTDNHAYYRGRATKRRTGLARTDTTACTSARLWAERGARGVPRRNSLRPGTRGPCSWASAPRSGSLRPGHAGPSFSDAGRPDMPK